MPAHVIFTMAVRIQAFGLIGLCLKLTGLLSRAKCFVFVRNNSLQPGIDHAVQQCPVTKNNNHAVVQRMMSPPHKRNQSDHVTCGKLSEELHLFDCETTLLDVAVVHKEGGPPNGFMVVANRDEWSNWFHEKMDEQ